MNKARKIAGYEILLASCLRDEAANCSAVRGSHPPELYPDGYRPMPDGFNVSVPFLLFAGNPVFGLFAKQQVEHRQGEHGEEGIARHAEDDHRTCICNGAVKDTTLRGKELTASRASGFCTSAPIPVESII
jgi:hypothetical protein